ncbi:hypothetical protein LK07_16350 [Streptomyces pluripotens]|uniref:Uncharacterized protein n=1 Tax=Streptomyces pluripotens TaxID=1355015 RepID=A0A221NZV0_9ACTN|nr:MULTISPECIES: hypothetical protein [Streptomyces]ARP71088.1 hypothetical protein LK06_015215 [Streptomyces pluripotens]ASN25336.1 hypothetical protein LK07_16350 [Streptomyces pluripotens]KIE25970.1 membrane protein [Streptomyces sp. MUSC 125]MCH0557137.1 hypothetical protein [Streptomyces sp. MUM 16J]
MAHAAPAPGRMSRPGRPPDVFSERTHTIARITFPIVLGLIYGYWVAADNRAGGPITGWNLLLGFVSTLVFAVVCFALLELAPRMPRELHALLWTAFVGCAFGFLYAQSNESIWRTVLLSLLISAATFVPFFYRYYTHEDAFGRRIR